MTPCFWALLVHHECPQQASESIYCSLYKACCWHIQIKPIVPPAERQWIKRQQVCVSSPPQENATTSTKATKTQSLLLRQIHCMLAEEERGCVACTSCVGRQQLYNHIHPFILRGNTDIKIKGWLNTWMVTLTCVFCLQSTHICKHLKGKKCKNEQTIV